MPLAHLDVRPPDPLLAIIDQYAADPRSEKIDLGVGVFRDDAGQTPVMAAVKHAEAILHERQMSKSYLGPEGDRQFVALIATLALGETARTRSVAGLQTPGGTGALRLAAELLVMGGIRRIWMATPSWPNHKAIFDAVGLSIMEVPCFDLRRQYYDFDRFVSALTEATPGDGVLLHGCCHNPTGIDPDIHDWRAIARTVSARGLLPLVDLAYQGLGAGLETDIAGARLVLEQAPYGLLSYSCDKNFGLYRDRTGAVLATAPDGKTCDAVMSNLSYLARANWSMPPDHGAAVVRLVLESQELAPLWRTELDAMRIRIDRLRNRLAALGQIGSLNLAAVAMGRGMFSTLNLTPSQVAWLRENRAIYMTNSGRINIAGFDEAAITRFGDGMHSLRAAGVA